MQKKLLIAGTLCLGFLAVAAWLLLKPEAAPTPAAAPTQQALLLPDPGKLHLLKPVGVGVRYYGRWDKAADGSIRTGRGSAYLRADFTGTCLTVLLSSAGQDAIWWRVSIDDGELRRFKPGGEETVLAAGLAPQLHSVLLVRDTEGLSGLSIIKGFRTDGTIVKPPKLQRKIEFIGDSVLAGAFAEGPGDYWEQENGYMSFGPQLARMLQADWSVIATSGEGVVLNASEEEEGTQTHALKDYLSPFNNDEEINQLNNQRPQLIIINHGANDFEAPKPPTPEQFIQGYMEMVRQVREQNPQAVIICLEPVPYESGSIARPLIRRAVKQLRREGVKDLHFIALNNKGQLLLDEDFADGEHPLVSGHTKVAEQLKDKVAALMKWY